MLRRIAPTIAVIALTVIAGGLLLRQAGNVNGQTNSSGCTVPNLRHAGFWDQTDFCQTSVPFDEIISGGPPPDGIPPIDNPQFESIEAANEWLQPQSPVIALEMDGEARAYPLAIMTRHEIVNDEIAGQPVAVTFCPLCNSAIVFDRTVDGQTLRMGVSGYLRNSDLIMWDDQTQSWWQQFTGEAIVGEYTGTTLDVLPSQVVGFGTYVEQFPDGVVLTRQSSGYSSSSYGTNPYSGYDSTDDPFLFQGDVDNRLFATERVLAGTIQGEAMAYPFSALSEAFVINDTIGDRNVVAFWQPGKVSALDRSNIDTSRDVGMAALFRREIDGQALTFTWDGDTIQDEETSSTWNVFGTAIAGELEGTQLRQELFAPHFWFAWAAFYPETAIYGIE